MSIAHFLRIERESADGASSHYVIHTHDPKFSMELTPDRDAPNRIGRGVIKRICIPNSWAGDYNRCAQRITEAQEFFTRSFGDPVAKSEARRFQT